MPTVATQNHSSPYPTVGPPLHYTHRSLLPSVWVQQNCRPYEVLFYLRTALMVRLSRVHYCWSLLQIASTPSDTHQNTSILFTSLFPFCMCTQMTFQNIPHHDNSIIFLPFALLNIGFCSNFPSLLLCAIPTPPAGLYRLENVSYPSMSNRLSCDVHFHLLGVLKCDSLKRPRPRTLS